MDDDCKPETVEAGGPIVGEDVGALSDDQLIRCKDAMETIYLDRPSNRQARRLLRKAIREVIANRRADLPPGTDRDGVVIAVHGESRSGKTALVNRLLAGEQRLASPSDGHTKLVVNIQVKGPATLKSAGLQILEALGYKPAGKMDEAPVWDRVYTQLRLCNSLVLHLGEMSNISRTLNVTERVKLRDMRWLRESGQGG